MVIVRGFSKGDGTLVTSKSQSDFASDQYSAATPTSGTITFVFEPFIAF